MNLEKMNNLIEEIRKSLENGDGKEAIMRLAEEIEKTNEDIKKLNDETKNIKM